MIKNSFYISSGFIFLIMSFRSQSVEKIRFILITPKRRKHRLISQSSPKKKLQIWKKYKFDYCILFKNHFKICYCLFDFSFEKNSCLASIEIRIYNCHKSIIFLLIHQFFCFFLWAIIITIRYQSIDIAITIILCKIIGIFSALSSNLYCLGLSPSIFIDFKKDSYLKKIVNYLFFSEVESSFWESSPHNCIFSLQYFGKSMFFSKNYWISCAKYTIFDQLLHK